MIYLDTSALMKLLFEEAESGPLSNWLAQRSDVAKVSSDLSTIELLRACRRFDHEAVEDARRLLGGIDLLPITRSVVDQAAILDPDVMRSLDAIHLASALAVKESVTDFVAYDIRLSSAATLAGLPVVSPA